ncbi:hypothetical protein [Desulfocurvus sp. DL9XJH121]
MTGSISPRPAPRRTPRFAPRKMLLLALALAVLCALATGCGKKAWPTPDDKEHSFAFTDVVGVNRNGCLVVTATVSGAWEDLDAVYLEYGDNDCPDCPFVPRGSEEFSRSDAGFSLDHGALRISRCGLNPGGAYRFRIIGSNVMRAVADVASPVTAAR